MIFVQAIVTAIVIAWAIGIIYMSRAGRALYVDTASLSRRVSTALKSGKTVNVGYYRLSANPGERTQIQSDELERILKRYAGPQSRRSALGYAFHQRLSPGVTESVIAALSESAEIEQHIVALSYECRAVRETSRRATPVGRVLILPGAAWA